MNLLCNVQDKTPPRTFDKELPKIHRLKNKPKQRTNVTKELKELKEPKELKQEKTQPQTTQESITWFSCTKWHNLHPREKLSSELLLLNNEGSQFTEIVYKISENSYHTSPDLSLSLNTDTHAD